MELCGSEVMGYEMSPSLRVVFRQLAYKNIAPCAQRVTLHNLFRHCIFWVAMPMLMSWPNFGQAEDQNDTG